VRTALGAVSRGISKSWEVICKQTHPISIVLQPKQVSGWKLKWSLALCSLLVFVQLMNLLKHF